jgi:hypothetical protein
MPAHIPDIVLLLVLLLTCFVARTASACEVGDVDERVAQTPTLGELIDVVGLEAIGWDVWTVSRGEEGIWAFTRRRAEVDGDRIIMSVYEESSGSMYAEVAVYSRAGELLEERKWLRDRERGVWDGEGDWWARSIVQGDTRIIQSLSIGQPREEWEWTEHKRELHTNQGISGHWLPLVIRYHLAAGHESFEVACFEGAIPPPPSLNLTYRFDYGGEEIEDNDETLVIRHAYESRTSLWPVHHPDPDPNDPILQYWLFHADGTLQRVSPPPRWALIDQSDALEERVEPGVLPNGFEGFEVMMTGDLGEEVFGPIRGENGAIDGAAGDE